MAWAVDIINETRHATSVQGFSLEEFGKVVLSKDDLCL